MELKIRRQKLSLALLRKFVKDLPGYENEDEIYFWLCPEEPEPETDYEEVHARLRDYIIKLKEVSKEGEKLRKSLIF